MTAAGAMDLENQKRVKEFAEQYGPENIVVLLGAAEGEASGLAAETACVDQPRYLQCSSRMALISLMMSSTSRTISIMETCSS